MPEGVEVSLLTEKIQKLKNCEITNITILGGRYSRHGNPKGFSEFKKNLPLKILNIHNNGKFIYFTLSNNWFILITLGMTGKINIHNTPIKHDHIQFDSCNNFFFNDMRNFGTIEFTNDPEVLKNKLDKLGFDPLTQKHITPSEFLAKIGRFNENKTIGQLLIDQTFVSGIGNYLRADILYCAKIHPNTLIKNLKPPITTTLLHCIYNIMETSYKKQKDKIPYKFIIYKQKLSPTGKKIEHFKDNAGRTIWFSPEEQELIR